MLSYLCQSLFGMTHCKPADTQVPEKKEAEATGNCRELHATANSSDIDSSRSNVSLKKPTVLIMVAPPTDLQQVG